ALIIYADGREICRNGRFGTAARRREYRRRTTQMVVRQGGRCCLEGYAPMCHGRLFSEQATFEHEDGRGMGGAKRDDRTELPDGTWINGAAHEECNIWKGSRYIDYNRSFQSRRGSTGDAPDDQRNQLSAGSVPDTGQALEG